MIIFVSDAFVENYAGGAELTTEAIIEGSYFPCNKVLSSQLTVELMEKYKQCFWIFGNFSSVPSRCLLYAVKNLNYSVIEYDYKFCKFRLVEKHIEAEGECNCVDENNGKLVATFLHYSKVNFWMSHGQLEKYCNLYPFLKSSNNVVLSSVFSEKTIEKIRGFDTSKKNNKWIILGSPSWVKGKEDAISYAQENKLEYEVLWGVDYYKTLNKLSKSKGVIFFPKGSDTCPRMIIEAKLLDCDLVLNDNVQHKDEEWFADKESIYQYLSDRTEVFWKEIEKVSSSNLGVPYEECDTNLRFKIIIPFYNAGEWVGKCIRSVKRQNYSNFQCYLIDDMSTDASLEIAARETAHDERFKIISNAESGIKKYALGNIADTISTANCSQEDVIILLDGDDWLSCSSVLSRLSRAYTQDECWMTYGSYVYFPGGQKGVEPSEYPKEVVEDNSFRKDMWRASHLRTFKYKIWKELDHKDLKDESGQYYKMTYDQAIMLPLLEMSGKRSKYISDVLHVYNKDNPLNVDKLKAQKQYKLAQKIRSKEPYTELQ